MNKYQFNLLSEDGFLIMEIRSNHTNLSAKKYYDLYIKDILHGLSSKLEETVKYTVDEV